MKAWMSLALAGVMGLWAPVSVAADSDPRAVVEQSISRITTQLKQDKQRLQQDPKALERLIEEGIEPFVDVPGIARGVMGQFFRQATPAQRQRFVKVFRDSMIRTYSNGLGAYNNQKIVVRPLRPSDNPARAQVDVEVTLDNGTVVPVVFQMVRDDQGLWKARNLIVNGLNLGLAFRQRFAQLVEQNRGSVERAINAWSPAGIDPVPDVAT